MFCIGTLEWRRRFDCISTFCSAVNDTDAGVCRAQSTLNIKTSPSMGMPTRCDGQLAILETLLSFEREMCFLALSWSSIGLIWKQLPFKALGSWLPVIVSKKCILSLYIAGQFRRHHQFVWPTAVLHCWQDSSCCGKE